MDKLDKLTGFFTKNQVKDTSIPLPPIDPLEAHANINASDTWQAVERFPTCLLLTDPILPDESQDYEVKDVTFNIKSNDQGWSTEDNFEGEYEGSRTWFEVAILRPVEGNVRISPRDKRSIASESCVKQVIVERKISQKLQFVLENDGPFWHLQRNRRGNSEPKEHTILWTRKRQDSENERLGWDFDAKTGEGSGVGFMESVKKGDRVAIIARAKQSGSINYISAAKIKITFEGFIPAPATGSTPDLTRSQTARSGALMPNVLAGEPKASSSTSDAKGDKPDAAQMGLSVSPLPTSSATTDVTPKSSTNLTEITQPGPTSSNSNTEQGKDEIQAAIVQSSGQGTSTVDSSTKVVPPTVTISAPTAEPLDEDAGSPVSPKSPKNSNRWRFPTGGKKKQKPEKNTKADPTTDHGAQTQSGVTTDTANPIGEGDEPAGLAIGDSSTTSAESTLASPMSPTGDDPKSPFWGLGEKVSWKAIRAKTFDKKGNVDKAKDSGTVGGS